MPEDDGVIEAMARAARQEAIAIFGDGDIGRSYFRDCFFDDDSVCNRLMIAALTAYRKEHETGA